MKWIIIDTSKITALHGAEQKTLTFSSFENAHETAKQLFKNNDDFIVVRISLYP